MPGVELSTSACDGHVVAALRGDLDVTGAADAGPAITALVVPGHCLIIDMAAVDFIACGSLAALQRHVPRLMALTGSGSRVLASCQRAGSLGGYRVIAAGAATVRAGSWRGWMRGCGQAGPWCVGAGGRVCRLGASRAASNRKYKEA
jgi:hypothetical protein